MEENGATVFIVGRRKERLEAAAQVAKHGNIIPIVGDVTSKSSLQILVDTITARTGYVNLLVANAGVLGPTSNGLQTGPDGIVPTLEEVRKLMWEHPMESVTDVYRVNVSSVLYTTIAFLGLLEKGNTQGNVRQLSQVLVTSSIGGFHRSWATSGLAYTTSKAAVDPLDKEPGKLLAYVSDQGECHCTRE